MSSECSIIVNSVMSPVGLGWWDIPMRGKADASATPAGTQALAKVRRRRRRSAKQQLQRKGHLSQQGARHAARLHGPLAVGAAVEDPLRTVGQRLEVLA